MLSKFTFKKKYSNIKYQTHSILTYHPFQLLFAFSNYFYSLEKFFSSFLSLDQVEDSPPSTKLIDSSCY